MLKFDKLAEDFVYPDAKMVSFKDEDIYIKQYLPLMEKYQLIYVCILSLNLNQQPYHPLTSEALFDIELVNFYTNIDLDNTEATYFRKFDVLHHLGLIDLVIENIPVAEYEEMQRLYEKTINAILEYNQGIGNALKSLLSDSMGMSQDLEGIDEEKLAKGLEVVEKLTKEKHI